MKNQNESPRGRVLITGAAGGIGFALAGKFAKNGYNLVLNDLNQENLKKAAAELKAVYPVQIKEAVYDLTRNGAPREMWTDIRNDNIEIDILVNNAGFGILGPFHENPLEGYLKMITLHVNVLTTLTKIFIDEHIKEQKAGKILNVMSIGAFMACPLFSTYHATKAYGLLFSEALYNELKPHNISVSILCPGAAKTNFQRTAKNEHVKAAKKGLMAPETIAACAFKGLQKRKMIIVPGFKNKFIIFLTRILPRKVTAGIMRSYYEE